MISWQDMTGQYYGCVIWIIRSWQINFLKSFKWCYILIFYFKLDDCTRLDGRLLEYYISYHVTGLFVLGSWEGPRGDRGVRRGTDDGGERGHHLPAAALRPHAARHSGVNNPSLAVLARLTVMFPGWPPASPAGSRTRVGVLSGRRLMSSLLRTRWSGWWNEAHFYL